MNKILIIIILMLMLISCTSQGITAPIPISDVVQTIDTTTSTRFPATATETPTPLPTQTPTSTETPIPSKTPTASITPTYAILRGSVNVERVSCRYGPGAMYLFLYGMLEGATQDIIGRNQNGSWVLTQSRGDVIRCWVKADLMNITGDVMSVEPVEPHIVLPWSPYYAPLTGVRATRSGNEVRITWNYLALRAGDDSEQTPYVVETWICQNGQLMFNPIGVYDNVAIVTDEPGCAEPSYGFVLAAEKHGYTLPVEIPWP